MLALIVFLLVAALLASSALVVRHARLVAALRSAHANAARFRLLAEHSADIGWIVDAASARVLYISPALEARFGIAPARAATLLQPLLDDLPSRLARLAGDEAGQRQQLRELDQAHPDGRTIPTEISSTLVTDADGNMLLVGTLSDISARRAQELAQKKFASMISHEFRTPLATIDGAIQRLEMTATNVDDATRKRYKKIQGAVERLLGMINEYLSPERMASIGRKRQANELVPRELLDGAAGAARKAHPSHPVTVSTSGLPDLMRCDPDGMRLCLQVLLDNAAKYTPAGTPVQLVGRPADGGGLEFLVIDHGPGIDPAELPRLFDKFFRGSNATAAGVAGTGLGLHMARAVLDVHGGTLDVVSGLGNGATFRIWLPIVVESGKTLAPDGCNRDNSSSISEVGLQNT